MTDKYSLINVGDCLDIGSAVVIPCVCASSVTKGQVVKANAHADNGLPTVAPQAAGTLTTSLGVALKSGDSGETIPVLVFGVVKVTAGAGGCTVGQSIGATPASSDPGTVANNSTGGQIIGRALQTLSSGDTGLVFICSGGG